MQGIRGGVYVFPDMPPNLGRSIFYHLGLDNLVNEVSAVCSAKNLTKFEHSASSKHPELLEVQMKKLRYTFHEIWCHSELFKIAIKLHSGLFLPENVQITYFFFL